MPAIVLRRVVSPILAVTAVAQRHRFVTISSGAIIETSVEGSRPGLRPIRLEGQELFAFNGDIEDRSECVVEWQATAN